VTYDPAVTTPGVDGPADERRRNPLRRYFTALIFLVGLLS